MIRKFFQNLVCCLETLLELLGFIQSEQFLEERGLF